MKANKLLKAAAAAIAVAGALGVAHDAAAQANEIFVPVLVYRTGAYAPNGVPWANGFVDYLKLVNERDGGVNGIKLAFEECETGYATDRGVECYERLKSKKPVAVNPLSTGITFALTEKVAADKITLMTTGYGRSESADGSVFAWNFPLLGTYWSAADMLVQHVAKKGSLKGKKIALVYHDSPYGKEPIKVLEEHAKKHGFTFIKLPVTHPGVEQKATWLQIRQQRPDYVFLWGWGVMNSTSIKEAIAVSYPRLQMFGVWWSSAEPDVLPAEMAAQGLQRHHARATPTSAAPRCTRTSSSTSTTRARARPARRRTSATCSTTAACSRAMLLVEAIRSAQGKYGKRVVTGEEVRWGAENLNLDGARIKALGIDGTDAALKTSCRDHEGVRKGRIHTWDGTTWSYTSDWYEADSKFLRPLIEAQAKAYAAEKKITPRDCSKEK